MSSHIIPIVSLTAQDGRTDERETMEDEHLEVASKDSIADLQESPSGNFTMRPERSVNKEQARAANAEAPLVTSEDETTTATVEAPHAIPQHLSSEAESHQREVASTDTLLDSKKSATSNASSPHPSKVDICGIHLPQSLPKFRDPSMCLWTSSHAANSPSEDRSCSLVNVLLKPSCEEESTAPALVRLSLWSVIDGHGGGCVATYASEVLLPHICASVSRALKCAIVDRGQCLVNGELRDINALDLDGLIRTSDRSRHNPNSIHYRAPLETIDAQEDHCGGGATSEEDTVAHPHQEVSLSDAEAQTSDTASSVVSTPVLRRHGGATESHSMISSVKTTDKTMESHPVGEGPTGSHSPTEVANISRAITESFLAVDEGWINSIDPIATHQTSCQTNGRWNAGACALVVMTVQRLEWTSTAAVGHVPGVVRLDGPRHQEHNKDAARRRMLDYKQKSASSVSTISSTSSMQLKDDGNAAAVESEITETEDDYDASSVEDSRRRRNPPNEPPHAVEAKPTLIDTPGGCACHSYRANDAFLYTAHVGDCRAVLLGSAPPRTIKVGPGASIEDHPDTTDDESSYHSSDETEILSSSDHDAESSDEDESELFPKQPKTPPYLSYMRRPARRQLRRSPRGSGENHAPFVALPPLVRRTGDDQDAVGDDGSESSEMSEGSPLKKPRHESNSGGGSSGGSSQSSQETREMSPPVHLAPFTRPIDLTTDHSAYNPAEVTAVLQRCKNAPRAISAGMGGGIKRVAGSLAVTRALGDAYLKTPRLSFSPYKTHAPYITARPEVNCRLLAKDGDSALILASDGVWERCSGEDVLRWIKNYSAERVAEAERRANRRRGIKALPEPMDVEKASGEEGTVARAASPSDDSVKSAQKLDRQDQERCTSPFTKKRKLSARRRRGEQSVGQVSTISDVLVRRVLNKVRRARNMSSLYALMTLPKGRARRSKHDDITATVVDLSGFVS